MTLNKTVLILKTTRRIFMYPLTIPIIVSGIPAKAKVYRCKWHRGTKSRFALDPEVFHGWYDLHYILLDRKGYKAGWLEKIADDRNLREELEAEIISTVDDYREGMEEDYQDWKRELKKEADL